VVLITFILLGVDTWKAVGRRRRGMEGKKEG
jgi:hypothetical protein